MGRSKLLMGLAVVVIVTGVLIAFVQDGDRCDGLSAVLDSEEYAILSERLIGAEPSAEDIKFDGVRHTVFAFALPVDPDGPEGHVMFLVNRDECSLVMVNAFEFSDYDDEYFLVRNLLTDKEMKMSKDDFSLDMDFEKP